MSQPAALADISNQSPGSFMLSSEAASEFWKACKGLVHLQDGRRLHDLLFINHKNHENMVGPRFLIENFRATCISDSENFPDFRNVIFICYGTLQHIYLSVAKYI